MSKTRSDTLGWAAKVTAGYLTDEIRNAHVMLAKLAHNLTAEECKICLISGLSVAVMKMAHDLGHPIEIILASILEMSKHAKHDEAMDGIDSLIAKKDHIVSKLRSGRAT